MIAIMNGSLSAHTESLINRNWDYFGYCHRDRINRNDDNKIQNATQPTGMAAMQTHTGPLWPFPTCFPNALMASPLQRSAHGVPGTS